MELRVLTGIKAKSTGVVVEFSRPTHYKVA